MHDFIAHIFRAPNKCHLICMFTLMLLLFQLLLLIFLNCTRHISFVECALFQNQYVHIKIKRYNKEIRSR